MARTTVFIAFVIIASMVAFAEDGNKDSQKFDNILKGSEKTEKSPSVTIMPARGSVTVTGMQRGTIWVPRGPANPPAKTKTVKRSLPLKAPGIVFLVDSSSSMIGYWKRVQAEVTKYIAGLDESTKAEIIIFSDGKPVSTSGKLSAADEPWKQSAVKLLNDTQPAGNTNPETALQAAVNVTGSVKDSIVYFISDGVFCDFGRSAMNMLLKNPEGRKCRIDTLMFGDPVIISIVSMRRIASTGGGVFRNVTGRR